MDISIIVPCRNEGSNVELLTERIVKSIPGSVEYELIFVDDSEDDTVRHLKRLAQSHPCVRFLHREHGLGLSSAIIEGFALAQGEWFIVMDADLQHPPESLPDLVHAIRQGTAEIIVPSRFIPGGSDGGLNVWRKFVSWTARMLARMLLRKVRPVSDPTSGYFAIRRETAFSQPLRPVGWKILLELLVRAEYTHVHEFPYPFQARDLGRSKFNLQEQWNYIRHLARLVRSSEEDYRFWKFCAVGMTGVFVNMALYIPLVKWSVPVGWAFACATGVAILSNFIWNNLFTWTHLKLDRLWYRMFKFFLVSVGGLILSSYIVKLSYHEAGIHYIAAGLIGVIVSTGWNFFLHNYWTFSRKLKMGMQRRSKLLFHRSRSR